MLNNNNTAIIFMPCVSRHYAFFIIALEKYEFISVHWSRLNYALSTKAAHIITESSLNVEKLPLGYNCLNTIFRRKYGLLFLLGRRRLLSPDKSLP